MNKKDINIWKNIAFKTNSYRKNFDLIVDGDNVVTEYFGTISELRITEAKPPIPIGEYGFSVWNISLAKMLNININKLISIYKQENTYNELNEIENKVFDVNKYHKIIFVHSLIIHPEYRKIGVTEEFVEYLYRDFYYKDAAIIALIKPIQDNTINFDTYFKKKISIKISTSDDLGYNTIPAVEYYSLNKLTDKDNEASKYRLFSIAMKCGFQRIKESNLFIFNPDIIIERIKEKWSN